MRSSMKGCVLCVLAIWSLASSEFGGPAGVLGLDNGLALTPPMGWLSWERFLCQIDCKTYPDSCISEKLYATMADVMATEGYLKAGYNFINIDDCWMADERDADGILQANYTRFPHGIKALANYIHSRGLKLGIYQDCGTKTCAGYPGSQGYFDKDARTFANWDVDMLKLDGCYADISSMDTIYPLMTGALNRSGRAIIYSCSWPAYQSETRKPNYKSISQHCNLWRNFDDIEDTWASVAKVIDYYAKVQDDLIPFSGPGAWSDPDMLMIGNFGLSIDQAKTQMAIWAILAAPLLISTDLRTIRPVFKKILLNQDVIDINQDKFGIMGRQIYNAHKIQIWVRPVGPQAPDGSMSTAIAIHSRYTMGSPKLVNVSLSSIGMNFEGGYLLNDLFGDQITNLTLFPNGYLAVRVNPSGVVMLKATLRDLSSSAVEGAQSSKPLERTANSPGHPDESTKETKLIGQNEADTLMHHNRQHMSSMGYGPVDPARKPPVPKYLSEVGYDAYSKRRET